MLDCSVPSCRHPRLLGSAELGQCTERPACCACCAGKHFAAPCRARGAQGSDHAAAPVRQPGHGRGSVSALTVILSACTQYGGHLIPATHIPRMPPAVPDVPAVPAAAGRRPTSTPATSTRATMHPATGPGGCLLHADPQWLAHSISMQLVHRTAVKLASCFLLPQYCLRCPLLMRCSGGRQLQPLHQTPLHVAAESGEVELAEMLLRRATGAAASCQRCLLA